MQYPMMPATHIQHLQCVLCGTTYDPAVVQYACPACGPLGVLAVEYDYEQIAPRISRTQLAEERDPTLWRYRALLPISYSHKDMPPLAIGGTPLYRVERLRSLLGMSDLWLKDDTRNPSASLKDRASIIAVMLSRREDCGLCLDGKCCFVVGGTSGCGGFAMLYFCAA